MKTLLFLILAGLSTSPLFTAQAQALTLSPAVLKLDPSASNPNNFTIRAFNEGKQALYITPSVSDWGYNDKGEKIFRPPGTLPFSLGPYVQIDTAPFILAPRQSRNVNIKLNVPPDKLGGHHAMAFFHAIPHRESPNRLKAEVMMAVRLGTTLLYESPDSVVIKSRIEKAEVQSTASGTALHMTVKNEGNTWIQAAGTVAIMDAQQRFVGAFKIPRQIVLRGQSLTLKAQSKNKLKPGTYQCLITYQYRGQSTTITRTLTV